MHLYTEERTQIFNRLLTLIERLSSTTCSELNLNNKRNISGTECEQRGDGKSKICPELA
jgi:hypothetical protein